MTQRIAAVWALGFLLVLSGCAKHYTEASVEDPYGFFWGLWHGIVFWFALLGKILSWFLSLFGFDLLSDIRFIGRPNTGTPYYVGFVIGLLSAGGSGSRTAVRSG